MVVGYWKFLFPPPFPHFESTDYSDEFPLPRPQLKANIECRTPNSECRSCLALASVTSTFDIRYSAVRYSLFHSPSAVNDRGYSSGGFSVNRQPSTVNFPFPYSPFPIYNSLSSASMVSVSRSAAVALPVIQPHPSPGLMTRVLPRREISDL